MYRLAFKHTMLLVWRNKTCLFYCTLYPKNVHVLIRKRIILIVVKIIVTIIILVIIILIKKY